MSHEIMSVGKLFFSFEGRIGRATFCFYNILVLNTVFWAIVLIGILFGGDAGFVYGYFIGAILVLIPGLALNVKRCHDLNLPGAFVLLAFIPILNLWYIVHMALLRGTEGDNKYGPDPTLKGLGKAEVSPAGSSSGEETS